MDGTGSATVFNGPTPLLDAMYTSTSNLITGNDVIMMSLVWEGLYHLITSNNVIMMLLVGEGLYVIMMSLLGGLHHLACHNDVIIGAGAPPLGHRQQSHHFGS